jgi:hypothetical protein
MGQKARIDIRTLTLRLQRKSSLFTRKIAPIDPAVAGFVAAHRASLAVQPFRHIVDGGKEAAREGAA